MESELCGMFFSFLPTANWLLLFGCKTDSWVFIEVHWNMKRNKFPTNHIAGMFLGA